jgi:GNAT superfamily N-acetyltransferase
MRFVLFGRYRPEQNALARDIFSRNGRNSRDFRFACSEDYWALLTDDDDRILAECTLSSERGLFSDRVQAYCICDVFVPEQYRGNQYAVALILNVMYELEPAESTTSFYLHAYRRNRSAIRCYRKIFGEPIHIGRRLVTFASNPSRSWLFRLLS